MIMLDGVNSVGDQPTLVSSLPRRAKASEFITATKGRKLAHFYLSREPRGDRHRSAWADEIVVVQVIQQLLI